MTRSFLLVAGSLALAACSSETPTMPVRTGPRRTPTPTSAAAESGGARGRSFAYTMLSDCETVREETEEGQYLEQECPGLGGYGVISTVGDLRANLQLAPPGGTPTSLDLSQIGGGGFSALGETLEWRGPAGKPLAPNSLIMRYNVVENPETNEDVSTASSRVSRQRRASLARSRPGPVRTPRRATLPMPGPMPGPIAWRVDPCASGPISVPKLRARIRSIHNWPGTKKISDNSF